MLETARTVLGDCVRAHELLEGDDDPTDFRVHWTAGIALARAVGHVLDKVEAPRDPSVAHAARAAYESWQTDRPSNAIFWEFIEEERNRLRAILDTLPVGVATEPLPDGNQRMRVLLFGAPDEPPRQADVTASEPEALAAEAFRVLQEN